MEEEQKTETTESEAKSKMSPILVIVVIMIIAILGIGFVIMNGKKSSQTEGTNMQGPTPEATSAPSESMVQPTTEPVVDSKTKSFEMEAGSFYFKPNQMTVKKGDTVKIKLTAKDMMHNFSLDEYKISSPIIKAGESTTIEFVADKAGTFEFYCKVGQHRKNGQIGTLVVTE